jgi:hypothetical protein
MRVDPDPARQGDDVVVVAPSLPLGPTGLTDCQLAWDGVPAGRCSASGEGSLTGDLVVPETAAAGPHEVTACRPICSDAVGGRESDSVVVASTPPDWLLAIALGAGALLVGAALSYLLRPSGDAALTLRPFPDPSPEVRTEVSVPAQQSLPLRLRSRPDLDPRVLTEVHDDHAR